MKPTAQPSRSSGEYKGVLVAAVLLTLLVLVLVLGVVKLGSTATDTWSGTDESAHRHLMDVPPSDHRWAVELREDADVEEVAAELHFENKGQVGSLKQTFVLRLRDAERHSAENVAARLEALRVHPQVTWSEEQVPKSRSRRE
jgi:ABC-type cobalt transport system substrate-binding protein